MTTTIASSCSAGFWSTPGCTEGVGGSSGSPSPCLSHNTEVTQGEKIPRGREHRRELRLAESLPVIKRKWKPTQVQLSPGPLCSYIKKDEKIPTLKKKKKKIPEVKSVDCAKRKLQNSLNSHKRRQTLMAQKKSSQVMADTFFYQHEEDQWTVL